ncbi:nucleoside hydrolase-like domain-containing protein [Membranihabitans maritimus]|uniref:nucleoside hydrolase-like domain-containing protein n=1 Tax=Membranihabitans maritimus TaxID=2904244 RepID=UPI001F3C800A|nr:nucleoside hydrolase-like domain-containing protein [Membranihabitans maritimus]
MKNLHTTLIVFLTINITISFTHDISQEKPKVIVLTDIGGDPDDEQSMVRLLLYSNELDLQAICVTSRLGHGQDIKPEILENQIKAYGKTYPNLIKHSPEFPTSGYLLSIIKEGQGNQHDIGEGFDTEASNAIINIVDKSKAIINIPVWGGLRELAQALWKYEQDHSPDEVKAFCQKIRVHSIGDQDKHRDYILSNFPHIGFIADAFAFFGQFGIREISAFRGMYMTGDQSLQNADWVRENVHNHGALSNTYPLSGHGTNGMKEGDSPSFLGLISNGLHDPDRPEWGGWGGRFRLLKNCLYIDAQDFLNGELNERHTVSRWRPTFQKDFMARLDWCIKEPEYANHNPIVSVNGHQDPTPMILSIQPGKTVSLDASESRDPDGDRLIFNWFIYEEISGNIPFTGKITSDGQNCQFTIPEDFSGKEIHLILEVLDSGNPALTGYKRIVFQIND